MRRVEESFPDAEADYLDGLTLSVADGWFNLRPSNTEPLLRLNVEAGDEDGVARIVDRIKSTIEGA